MLLEKKLPARQSGRANGSTSKRRAINNQSPLRTVVMATASRRHKAGVRRPKFTTKEATM